MKKIQVFGKHNNANLDEIMALLKIFNGEPMKYQSSDETQQILSHSRTVLLLDATGSMGPLIDGVKSTISGVFRKLKELLTKRKLDEKCFDVQISVYRNYEDGPVDILESSPWASDPSNLSTFIEGVRANGGARSISGNEAVEV